MSKQSLVYLRPADDETAHTGCGVVVAGGLIATCRHVWVDASAGGEVVARLPHPGHRDDRGRLFKVALFDSCAGGDAPAPDLVFLAFVGERPAALAQTAMAHEDRHQSGACYCRARLPSRNVDEELEGQVGETENEDGLRSFVATQALGYWFEKGSSGAPVFRGGAMVGLLRERDAGGGGQPNGLRMSYIVPASVILPHLMRAMKAASDLHIHAEEFQELLIAIGQEGLPPREIPRRMMQIVAAQQAAAREPLAPSNLGSDVTDAIKASRKALESEGAGAALAKLDAELRARRDYAALAEAALLGERARVEKLSLRWDAAKATYAELAALVPDDGGDAHIAIGDIEWRYGHTGAALGAYREALRRAPVGSRREGLAQDRIGDTLARQGDGAGALDAYRKGLAIAERLAAADPASAEAQRDLSVSHEKVGDMLARQGDGAGALDAYRKGLAIAEHLAAADQASAEAQRDLSVSHNKVGAMLARQGDGAGALAAYRKSLDIRERLAADDPASAEAQRDLSVSHNNVGDMLARQGDGAGALAAYRKSLAIAERLAADDPASAEAQRDLSVSHEKVGDMLARQGDGAGALAAYRKSLTIDERLAADDPASAEAQRDLSVSHTNVGDMLARQGDGAGALVAYRKSLAIAERLAAADQASAEAQRDLIVSCVKLSEVDADGGVAWLERAFAIAAGLAGDGRLAPDDAWLPDELRKRLAAAKSGRARR